MFFRTFPRFFAPCTFSCAKRATRAIVLPTTDVSLQHSTCALQTTPRRRALSTPSLHTHHSDLPMDRYHVLADATMTSLLERLEDLLDEMATEGFEVDYHSGVLTLNLGSNGTYVINKQPPNKQIWLSSPVSGPKRYDYMPSTDDWRYSRNGEEIGILLDQELSRALGRDVKLGLGRFSNGRVNGENAD